MPPTTHLHRRTLLATLCLWAAAASAQPATATIAAASDLKFALEDIAAQFEKTTGHRLRLVFGSSGNFFTQIQQGAPFHLYLSADESYVFKLADAGLTADRGRLYAYGRIGLFVPKGSPVKADGELKDLARAVQAGEVAKFAIANPEHAPYGARAREALQHAGLWNLLQPKLVLGENISQAAQFAASGATQGGIIAQSLAMAPQIAKLGDFALIPAAWHQPLAQRMVLLKNAPPAARAFYDHLATPAAQATLARYGFGLPRP
jgi:molybdate transport system substrate-binding protein